MTTGTTRTRLSMGLFEELEFNGRVLDEFERFSVADGWVEYTVGIVNLADIARTTYEVRREYGRVRMIRY